MKQCAKSRVKHRNVETEKCFKRTENVSLCFPLPMLFVYFNKSNIMVIVFRSLHFMLIFHHHRHRHRPDSFLFYVARDRCSLATAFSFLLLLHTTMICLLSEEERESSVPIFITNGIMLLSINDKYKHKYSTHRPRRVSETAETQRNAMLMGDPINRFSEENGSPSSKPTGRKEEVTCF